MTTPSAMLPDSAVKPGKTIHAVSLPMKGSGYVRGLIAMCLVTAIVSVSAAIRLPNVRHGYAVSAIVFFTIAVWLFLRSMYGGRYNVAELMENGATLPDVQRGMKFIRWDEIQRWEWRDGSIKKLVVYANGFVYSIQVPKNTESVIEKILREKVAQVAQAHTASVGT